MGTRSRRPSTQWLGQHSLKNHKLAASLVRGTGISSSDLVVEVGAGDGILTKELVRLAGHVLAVELDPTLAIILVKRFADDPNVLIIAGDFLDLPLPAQAFRVFGNIPFGSTTRILRHLLDPTRAGTLRADLIVERGVAIKRAEPRYGNLLNLCWAPWWEFRMGARISARSFEPAPSVDAALLTIVKRRSPLLPEQENPAFVRFVRAAFAATELKRAMRPFFSPRRFESLSRELAFPPRARCPQLDIHQWIALYQAARSEIDPGGAPKS